MLSTLIPQGTFFTQVVNHGILGHYVATASIATGAYETLNNFALTPPHNPTVFEYFRKQLARPAQDAWVVAPSNGFNRIGASDARTFGDDFGAQVLLPKQLLAAAGSTDELGHLLRDNYETTDYASAAPQSKEDLHRTAEILKLSHERLLQSTRRAWPAPTNSPSTSPAS